MILHVGLHVGLCSLINRAMLMMCVVQSAEDLVIQNLEASGKTYAYLIAIINQLQVCSGYTACLALFTLPSACICG